MQVRPPHSRSRVRRVDPNDYRAELMQPFAEFGTEALLRRGAARRARGFACAPDVERRAVEITVDLWT